MSAEITEKYSLVQSMVGICCRISIWVTIVNSDWLKANLSLIISSADRSRSRPSLLLAPTSQIATLGWCPATCMIGCVPGFVRFVGHITKYIRNVLHWLPVQQHIHYRNSSIVWRCVFSNVSSYLLEIFILTGLLWSPISLLGLQRRL